MVPLNVPQLGHLSAFQIVFLDIGSERTYHLKTILLQTIFTPIQSKHSRRHSKEQCILLLPSFRCFFLAVPLQLRPPVLPLISVVRWATWPLKVVPHDTVSARPLDYGSWKLTNSGPKIVVVPRSSMRNWRCGIVDEKRYSHLLQAQHSPSINTRIEWDSVSWLSRTGWRSEPRILS